MDQNIIVPLIIASSIVIVAVTNQIIQYRLKKEQIKADASVKIEEINAKNRLEMEKIFSKNENAEPSVNKDIERFSDDEERVVREKINNGR
ncbi:MAG: hypothetical protein ACOYWZ_18155 [Bacillota bacterium]